MSTALAGQRAGARGGFLLTLLLCSFVTSGLRPRGLLRLEVVLGCV